jgi:hypothetical protein
MKDGSHNPWVFQGCPLYHLFPLDEKRFGLFFLFAVGSVYSADQLAGLATSLMVVLLVYRFSHSLVGLAGRAISSRMKILCMATQSRAECPVLHAKQDPSVSYPWLPDRDQMSCSACKTGPKRIVSMAAK